MHRTAFTKGAADGSLLFNPFDMQMKNVANTGVLHWGNKLLALYEVRIWGGSFMGLAWECSAVGCVPWGVAGGACARFTQFNTEHCYVVFESLLKRARHLSHLAACDSDSRSIWLCCVACLPKTAMHVAAAVLRLQSNMLWLFGCQDFSGLTVQD